MSSKLLIEEPPLLVQPTLAVLVGLNEALFLQQVHYWLNPRFNKNVMDEKLWVHNTYGQWQKQFPFWGEKTIRRTIGNLEEIHVLESRVTTIKFKKTKFYTINYNELDSLKCPESKGSDPSGQSDQTDLPKQADACGQSDQIDQVNLTSLYIDTETSSENTLPHKRPSAKNLLDEEEELAINVIDIWNCCVQKHHPSGCKASRLTKNRKASIIDLYNGLLENNLTEWESYCKKIASNRFLMGDNDSGFVVSIDWALKAENFLKVVEGAIYDKPKVETIKDMPWTEFEAELRNATPNKGWANISLNLAKTLGQTAYKSWFVKVTPIDLDKQYAVFSAETRFIGDYIQSNFGTAFLHALQAENPHIRSFEFKYGGGK